MNGCAKNRRGLTSQSLAAERGNDPCQRVAHARCGGELWLSPELEPNIIHHCLNGNGVRRALERDETGNRSHQLSNLWKLPEVGDIWRGWSHAVLVLVWVLIGVRVVHGGAKEQKQWSESNENEKNNSVGQQKITAKLLQSFQQQRTGTSTGMQKIP